MRFAGSPQVASFLSDSVDHGALQAKGARSRAMDMMAADKADAKVAMAEDSAAGILARAELGAEAQAAAAKAAQPSGLDQALGIGKSLMGFAGSFGGGGGSLFGGGGGSSFTPTGGWGNFGNHGW